MPIRYFQQISFSRQHRSQIWIWIWDPAVVATAILLKPNATANKMFGVYRSLETSQETTFIITTPRTSPTACHCEGEEETRGIQARMEYHAVSGGWPGRLAPLDTSATLNLMATTNKQAARITHLTQRGSWSC